MSRLIRGSMIALLLTGGMLTLASRRASAQTPPLPPHLTVTGQGIVTSRPDLALVTLGASVRRPTAAQALDRANTVVAAVNEVLRAQGIAERDITTRQFNLSAEYGRGDGNSPPPVVGWRAVNLLTIKVRDFSKVGPLIDAAAGAMGDDGQISGISFTIEDTSALARQARDAAIADARERAQQMAAAAGVRLVRILSITETSAPPSTPQASLAAAPGVAAARASAPTDISPGEQSLGVTVEIVYEIQ